MSPQDYSVEEHERLHDMADEYFSTEDKQAIAQHVEYSLSELIDMLENKRQFAELRKTLEIARQLAEDEF